MKFLVYSKEDSVSEGIANAIMHLYNFSNAEEINSYKHFFCKQYDLHMLELNTSLLEAELLDNINADLLVILSKHSSQMGVPSMSVHATGNWSDEAKLGGEPRKLSVAAPVRMHALIVELNALNKNPGIEVTYEATHHGPLLNTPSLFAEIEEHSFSQENAEVMARAVIESLQKNADLKIAVGIGGTHYPKKFTSMALNNGYAFSHIMPKYYVDNVDMLEEAINRSEPVAKTAVIDWKSLNAKKRDMVIAKLDEIGIRYERI
ncbi:MAG: D-aminoacyl-tRNA deacylase [Candidatus Micrarchaeia archaeon]